MYFQKEKIKIKPEEQLFNVLYLLFDFFHCFLPSLFTPVFSHFHVIPNS